MTRTLTLALLLAVRSVAAVAQSTTPPALPATLSGTWEGSMDHEGSVWHLAFDLQQSDTTVAGTLYRDGEEYGPLHGSVHDGKFLFYWQTLPFEGTIDGDRLQIQLTVYNGTRYRFTMQRRTR